MGPKQLWSSLGLRPVQYGVIKNPAYFRHMLSRRIAIPFALWLGIILYLVFMEQRTGVMVWMIPPALILMLIYTFSPQIDWWWMEKHPPQADEVLKHLLQRINPWYRSLSPADQVRFETRVLMYVEGRDFSPIQGQELKEDEKCLIAAGVAHMTFYQDDFLIDPFEKIIFYQHPFPSPHFPYLHICESDGEDGILIFSLEQVWQGWLNPHKAFNPVYYELAKVLRCKNQWNEPQWPQDIWEQLTSLCSFKKDWLSEYLGFKEPDVFGVGSSIFFTFPLQMRAKTPDLYAYFCRLYNFPALT